jgi:hypothetical protein
MTPCFINARQLGIEIARTVIAGADRVSGSGHNC